MAGRLDLDLYNVLLGFGSVRDRVELVRATADPRLPAAGPARTAADPWDRSRAEATARLAAAVPLAAPWALAGQRVALIAGGGAGACVSRSGSSARSRRRGSNPS